MNPIKKLSELAMRLTGATNENDVYDPDEEAYNEALKSVPYAQRGMTPPPFPTEEDDFEPEQAPSRPPKRTPTAPAVSTETDSAKPAEGSRPNNGATGGAKMNTGALEELRRNAQAAQDRRNGENDSNILTPEETPATPAPTPAPKPVEAKQPDAVDSLTAFVSAYAEAKNAKTVLPLWKVGTYEDGTPVLHSREQMQAFFGADPSMEKAEYYFADSVTAGKPVKASAEAVRRYRLKTALHEAGLL